MNDQDLEKYKNPDGSIDWLKCNANQVLSTNSLNKKSTISLEKMSVFKLANELADMIWKIVAKWEWFAKKTIGDQVTRSADSIGANIAEGYGRYFFKEYVLFLYYARGSIYETKYWINKASQRNLITQEEYKELKDKLDQLPIEINKVVKVIKTQSKKWKFKK